MPAHVPPHQSQLGGGGRRFPLPRPPPAAHCLLLLLLPFSTTAQSRFVTAGNKAYDALAYSKAIASYERAAENAEPDSAYARKLAKSYLNVRDFAHAEAWYARVLKGSGTISEDSYNYAQTLRANGKFDEADKWLKTYEQKNGTDSRTQRQADASTYGVQLRDQVMPGCTVKNLEMNTSGADMGASYLGKDGVVFASDRSPNTSEYRRHTWNGQPFLDLYRGVKAVDGSVSAPIALKDMNTRYHESNATFSADGKMVWFTRNNFHKGKKGKNGEGVVNLKIFSRENSNGKWINEQPFAYNSDAYSVGHPWLSRDGNTLYFTSDRPGGVGGTDIWRTARNGAAWSAPVCLGSEVNTEGDEMFPFIGSDGTFAFSSDGQPGLGGHDILTGRMTDAGEVTGVKNPGAPLNSSHDDFALVLDSSATKGYFTSDRPGGKGGDDIYSFALIRALGNRMQAKGTAIDRNSKQLLQGVKVQMKDAHGHVLAETITDSNGDYSFDLEEKKDYTIGTTDGAYRDEVAEVRTGELADTTIRRDLLLARSADARLWMHVTNAKDGNAIEGVNVEVTDAGSGAVVMNGSTDASGDLRNALTERAFGDSLAFRVRLSKSGFFPKRGLFTHAINKDGEIAMHHTLDLNMEPMDIGADLGKAIDIKPIYFDLNKFNIRTDAAEELDKVVAVMKENPVMEIELGSHTDSRGSDGSNAALSDRRAKSSAAYIVSKGIARGRIKGKGFGESKLLNKCVNGTKCSEGDHQLNRRTEFIITKM
jgi:outer membrane protein OmpA-like peptidoglycan-associated protein